MKNSLRWYYVELTLVCIPVFVGIWIPNQTIQNRIALYVGLFMLISTLVRKVVGDYSVLPYRHNSFSGLSASAKMLCVAIGLWVGIFVLHRWGMVNVYFDTHDRIFSPIWSVLQQSGIMLYLWPRLVQVAKDRAVMAMTVIFTGMHLPNLALMILTGVFIYFCCGCYRKAQSYWVLAPLSSSHYLFAQASRQSLPDWLVANNHAGIWYLYDIESLRHIAMWWEQFLGLV